MSRHTSIRGSILIIALWTLCLLTVFTVQMGFIVRQKISLAKRLEERKQLRYIACAGIKKTVALLNQQIDSPVKALKDSWSNNAPFFSAIESAQGICQISYDYLNEKTNAAETRFGVVDEERKININTCDLEVLRRLIEEVFHFSDLEAQELAAAIIDWRDADSELSIPLGSAEDSYYRNESYPYEAKDGAFQVPEELLLVKGVTKEIFATLKEYVTMYGSGRVNINTASRQVLLALGLPPQLVDKIMLFRWGQDGSEATFDDNVFNSPGEIVSALSQGVSLSASEVGMLSNIVDRFCTTSSNFYFIRSTAKLNFRNASYVTEALVHQSGKILYWREL